MSYQFKKWFFDLNINEETYIYFILVEIKFLFFKIRNFKFHYFNHTNGSLTKSKSVRLSIDKDGWEGLSVKGKQLNFVPEDKGLNIVSDFNDLKINLKINNYQKHYFRDSLIINHKNKRIEWFPVPLSMTASGTIEMDKNLLRVENAPAYIDHVFSNILPFNTPVSKMYWGRLLHAEILITYSIVYTSGGKEWSECIVMMNNQRLSFSDIQYIKIKGSPDEQENEKDESIYQLTARNVFSSITMKIHHQKIADNGAFIVPEQYKFKNAYRILNKISKNPRGKKFISKAELMLNNNGEHYRWDKLVCIDEYVLF